MVIGMLAMIGLVKVIRLEMGISSSGGAWVEYRAGQRVGHVEDETVRSGFPVRGLDDAREDEGAQTNSP